MRFKISDRMLAAFSGLLIIALGLAVALVGSGLMPTIDFSKLLYGPYELWQRIVIFAVALLLVLLGVHGLHMLFRRRNGKGFIVQRTDMGDMNIAISALSSMVHKCVDQHQEIAVKKIHINRVRGGIIVDLKILLANGINIPLTVNVLQKQIKQYITSCSGVDVHEVRVQIGTTDKTRAIKAEEVPALEQVPVVALQEHSESAAESILRHTEEPADYVEPAVEAVEYTEPVVENAPVVETAPAEQVVEAVAEPVAEAVIEAVEPVAEVAVEAAEPVVEAVAEEIAAAETFVADTVETAAETVEQLPEAAGEAVEAAAEEFVDFYQTAEQAAETPAEETQVWAQVGDAFVRQESEEASAE